MISYIGSAVRGMSSWGTEASWPLRIKLAGVECDCLEGVASCPHDALPRLCG